MIRGCGAQVRTAFGGAVGLDFGAVLQFAEANGCANPLLAELLPAFEPLILRAWRKDGDDDDDR